MCKYPAVTLHYTSLISYMLTVSFSYPRMKPRNANAVWTVHAGCPVDLEMNPGLPEYEMSLIYCR
jgi:hypothetical protein